MTLQTEKETDARKETGDHGCSCAKERVGENRKRKSLFQCHRGGHSAFKLEWRGRKKRNKRERLEKKFMSKGVREKDDITLA